MVINWVLERPAEYGRVDYDGLWKKLIYELFEEFVLFFAADLYEEIDFLKIRKYNFLELDNCLAPAPSPSSHKSILPER